VIGEHEAYCQPCVSPVWDTALTCHALAEAGGEDTLAEDEAGPRLAEAAAGARPQGRLGGEGPRRPSGRLGVPVQQRLLSRSRRHRRGRDGDGPRAPGLRQQGIRTAIARGREWIEGLQSRDGGWAAFDVNNLEYYLNNIPFSDHGALLDPPTEDVTARCISMLAQLGETAETSKAVADGIAYLRRTQLAEGSWYGRWGLNYVYGTWSVLCALNAAGVDHQDPMIRKAADWLGIDPERGWRLGRGCGQLPTRLQGI
jgi:squalene-hopene/tetraprenyl-beta-curcumene cyclase